MSPSPCHRLLRPYPSSPRLLKSPLAGPRKNTDDSHSSSACPRSRLGASDLTADTSTDSRSPAHMNSTDPQLCTGRLLINRAPEDVRGLSSQASQPVTMNDAAALDPAQIHSPHGWVGRQPTHLPHLLNPADSAQSQQALIPPRSPNSSTGSSRQSLDAKHLNQSSSQYSLQPQYQKQGILTQAHDFTMTRPTFIDGNVNITASNQFMKDFLKETIPGAAFDSSARYPPPRCHPGTRLTIVERCLYFIAHSSGEKKIRWVVGAAGVGKSAIMQSVAESPNIPVTSHASVFFSINGRDDGTKAIVTLSYQFAAKSDPYRRLIEDEIARDPSLLQSSMPVQFNKLIVEPFIHHPQLNSAGRVLIIIDGLDECNNPRTQQELLRLISDFCTTYPSSPIVWLIASRPEPHIASFFSRSNVVPTYEKEEVPVDSDDARADVEQYLRHELTAIRGGSDSLDPEWPEERDLWKLANAAGGLFAYAHTVIRYIGDSTIGSPVSQLSDVLDVINNHPMPDVPREEHPMALLDALYARILSRVPPRFMINARKLLLTLATNWGRYLWYTDVKSLVLVCDWLGLTPDEAYAALNHLRSVLRVPGRDKAHEEMLKPFHKSFIDYFSDFTRSGFSPDIEHEAQAIMSKCAFRILNEAPDGINFGGKGYGVHHGALARGPGTGDKISLTWLVGGNDNVTRFCMYKLAIEEVVSGIERGDPTFQSEFCFRVLTARFQTYDADFPHSQLRDSAFAEIRRDELMMQGILKQMPLDVIDTSKVMYEVKAQFRRLGTTVTANLPDSWNPSCTHEREGEWEEGINQNWVTSFEIDDCASCSYRLEHHLTSLKLRSPGYTVPALFSSTGDRCVEFRFVDPEDGMSEWTYWFWCDPTREFALEWCESELGEDEMSASLRSGGSTDNR